MEYLKELFAGMGWLAIVFMGVVILGLTQLAKKMIGNDSEDVIVPIVAMVIGGLVGAIMPALDLMTDIKTGIVFGVIYGAVVTGLVGHLFEIIEKQQFNK